MISSSKIVKKAVKINGKEISFEVGNFAEQATAAVLVRSGDTIVHVTVVVGEERPELGYFPLTVDHQEKLYAGGIIKGSRWLKRDGRPADDVILKSRLIDRSIRPLFPKGYKKEVQVVATVLSYDQENEADMLSLCGTSAALAISCIPWQGPIAAVKIGLDEEDKPIINPTKDQLEKSKLNLIVSGSDQAIVMVEAGANEVSETQMINVLEEGHLQIKEIIAVINQLVKEVGVKKEVVVIQKIATDIKKQILDKSSTAIDDLIKGMKSGAKPKTLKEIIIACVEELPDIASTDVNTVIEDYFATSLRRQLFEKNIRPDGRKETEIRHLSSKVNLLPRTHGSGLFKRGATQALTITTLGSPSQEQWLEGIKGKGTKRYIHHYNFAPYSVGETGRIGYPSRREIGHGDLAERALLPMIPDGDKFPYTIQVVSEIMSSNGSTSMASVCGSTLSLMDAGVPIKKPVAGIAMGLMVQLDDNEKTKKSVVLTDIQGLEDHIGDMDFKVAGTADGITALQMDIKISGITFDVLDKALKQAKIARLTILKSILDTLDKPRPQVSTYAPKISVLNIPEDKIGEVIGPGGRVIREIIKETDCEVDVDDSGRVTISGKDAAKVDQAINWVDGLTREIKVGEEFDGRVVRIEPFGVFVELLPGRDGMVHVSKLSTEFVANPEDVVQMGDSLHVRVAAIDDMNRVNLTTLTPEQEQTAKKSGFRRDGRGNRSNDSRRSSQRHGQQRYQRRR